MPHQWSRHDEYGMQGMLCAKCHGWHLNGNEPGDDAPCPADADQTDGESVRIVQLDQTCMACPSQWEGRLDDGRAVYIRYRGGWGRIAVGATVDDAVLTDDYVFEWFGDHPLDGSITLDELKALVPERIVFAL